MSIEEIEWQETVEQYAESVCANIPGEEPRIAVKHLVSIGHISKSTVVKHMTLAWYPHALAENSSKMGAITDIAVRLNVSEKTIYSIISVYKR